MEKKSFIFKIIATVFFLSVVLGAYFYVIFGEFSDLVKSEYLEFACVVACFAFALFFVRLEPKKVLLTLAMATAVVADGFLMLSDFENKKLIGVSIFCGVEIFFMIYTLLLNRSLGTRIINLALRVAFCLMIYFIVPNYITIGVIEMISLMYMANFVVTVMFVLIHIKTEWLTFLGMFLLFACNVFVGIENGGAELLKCSSEMIKFFNESQLHFDFYIPALYLISSSSVWAKKRR